MSKQSTGEFLAILRKANGFTQQEVAEKLNISNRTLSSWETDRTTPDIYMLPAIADLYGVTVDELLRGERGESEKQAEISQSALHSARKLQFAKLSLRSIFLTSFACFGAVLFVLAACLNLYTASPVWLVALIAVLGGGGIIVCTVLQIYFYYKAKYAGGIVFNDDLTEDKKGYALALKRKFQLYFWISAIPLLLFAFVLSAIHCAVIPENSYTVYEYVKGNYGYYEKVTITVNTNLKTRYLVFMFICLAAGLAMLITYFICRNNGLKNIMNETQLQAHKYNKKLAWILFGSSALPVLVTFILYLWELSLYDDYLALFYLCFIIALVVSIVVCGIIY
ncbi:MAG: helix-turn-helix domain-containing protein, partial [Clostridia bacterium]|nr:helix-turn-helix domain-containing protein [Clostridia bacterium]